MVVDNTVGKKAVAIGLNTELFISSSVDMYVEGHGKFLCKALQQSWSLKEKMNWKLHMQYLSCAMKSKYLVWNQTLPHLYTYGLNATAVHCQAVIISLSLFNECEMQGPPIMGIFKFFCLTTVGINHPPLHFSHCGRTSLEELLTL